MLRLPRIAVLLGLFFALIVGPASAQSGARSNDRATHVFLLRGLLNVFSLGLDDLAEKLERRGIAATVYNHTEYEDIANRIIARYRAGWRGPVVLVGHSLGADNVYPLAAILNGAKVPVALIVSFDPVGFQDVPSNVSRAVNYYVSGAGYPVSRGRGFRGELQNIDMAGKGDYGHLNIEKSPALHAQVISRVASLRASAPRSAAAPRPISVTPAADPTGSISPTASTGSAPAAPPAPAAGSAPAATPAAAATANPAATPASSAAAAGATAPSAAQ